MIELKPYQVLVLDSLATFFRQCAREGRPDEAFRAVIERNGLPPVQYVSVAAKGLDAGMPYVCVRVPTGGGKTLLACHTAGAAINHFLHADRSVVLWLVPSNTILDQTADALRDPRHPYRRALETSCGAVEVVTIEEALRLPRAVLDGQTVVIVATIQAFRVEEKAGRQVYAQNGALADHMLNLPSSRLGDLERGVDGKPVPCLANVLRLRRPVVIVDEAHNARTPLSFTTLGNIRPSCVIEFTATPSRKGNTDNPLQNVLHRVSAAELKAADMVKLPLRVITRHPSQRDQLLAEAVALRSDLEKLAGAEGQETGEYLRPILLVQAERVDDCEPLRESLVRDFGVTADDVKISTGKKDELKGVTDIAAPTSSVRVILTVDKLREGWDCPFAYVLCSLKATRSATAIEQIVGRILRLPVARPKRRAPLNCGYVFSLSPSIVDVLAELRDALVENGFTSSEAARVIEPAAQGSLLLGLQPRVVSFAPATEIDVVAVAAHVATLGGKIGFDADRGDVTIVVPLDDRETEGLVACVTTPEAKERVRAAVAAVRAADIAFGGDGKSRTPSPYERGIDFVVPKLSVRDQATLFEFEASDLLEHPWRLSAKDASLPVDYDPRKRPGGQFGSVDIARSGHAEAQVAGTAPDDDFVRHLHQQVFDLGAPGDWTFEHLVAWLDGTIEHRDIPIGESGAFVRSAVRGLMTRLGISDVGVLALDRFRLRDAVEARIEDHRRTERSAAFQGWLLPTSQLAVDERHALNFKTMQYEASRFYEGSFRFARHYFGPRPGELEERTTAGNLTEEFRCAQFLDRHARVRFWVRNLVRKDSSFSLQTSTDRFYPDFICQLDDGRILVVEYKGSHLASGRDAEEKRAVGAVWAARSGGRCLFVMPDGFDLAAIDRAIEGSR